MLVTVLYLTNGFSVFDATSFQNKEILIIIAHFIGPYCFLVELSHYAEIQLTECCAGRFCSVKKIRK